METKIYTSKLTAVQRRRMIWWLYACCLMVVIMVTVGGITRLTDSGLSMVNWHPIHGVIPPITEEEWLEEFNAYRQSPEYIKINKGMSLSEFKRIFAWEYIHRMLGRLTGLVFFIPFCAFLLLGYIHKPLFIRLFFTFSLGGMQGLIGWYMVKSGLVDNPHVSQYRLALHLGTAFILFGLLWWTALTLACDRFTPHPLSAMRYFSFAVTSLLFIQIISGAFVAGLNAGLVYNSFPKMGDYWLPPELTYMQPLWQNITDNPVTVQFIHRVMALITTLTISSYCFMIWRYKDHFSAKTTIITVLFFITLLIQISLGISTLLYHVPVTLASLHQLTALVLLGISLFLGHSMLYSRSL